MCHAAGRLQVSDARRDTDIGSGEGTIGAVTRRERLAGMVAVRICADPPGFCGREGPCDAVTTKAVRFFHDLSWYSGRPVTPSNVSMMIIWPRWHAGDCLRECPVRSS